MKNYVNVPSKSNKQKNFLKIVLLAEVMKVGYGSEILPKKGSGTLIQESQYRNFVSTY